jgi:uncharacterized protein (DUF433 family)
MAGKPIVKGTSIPAERVVAHLANNPDLAELFAAYPELTVEDVKACLKFAHAAIEGKRQRVGKEINRKLLKAAEKVGGSLEHEDTPGWESSESTAEWVRASRRSDNERLERIFKEP